MGDTRMPSPADGRHEASPLAVSDLIGPGDVLLDLRAADKARALAGLAGHAADVLGLDVAAILAPLVAREGLGSTGLGQGVALPHARIEGLQRAHGLIARLERAVAFGAIDDRPVDIIALLLLPTGAGNEQLAALACVSRRLRDPDAVGRMRAAGSGADLHGALVGAIDRSGIAEHPPRG